VSVADVCAVTGKHRYRDKAHALESAVRQAARRLRIYRCPWCSGYHLTTKDHRDRRRRK
jgi:hypothetical protein